MRGTREVFYEYILELRGRMDDPSKSRRGMHVIAGEYHDGILFELYLRVVLIETDNVSCP